MSKEKRKLIEAMALVLMLGIILFFSSGEEEKVITGASLERNEPGEGKKEYLLFADVGDEKIDNIEIIVDEREYSLDECKVLAGECRASVITQLLNGNEDLRNITDDFAFNQYIEGYPFEITYKTDTPEYIGKTGEILFSGEFVTEIDICLSYGEYHDEFSVRACVKPSESVRRGIIKNELEAKLRVNENVTDKDVHLPTEVSGERVSYTIPGKEKNPAYIVLAFSVCLALLYGAKNDEKKEEEKRKEQILSEYPVMLQKMSLYLASGMTIRNALTRIYEEGKKKKGSPLYEEMGISINELQSGISEGVVYERLGERTKVTEMVRFTALLSQNLKKGSSKLKNLLSEESDSAFTKKKQRAVKKGEEAGTKLLFPMIMLLTDALLMIMIPAFLSI